MKTSVWKPCVLLLPILAFLSGMSVLAKEDAPAFPGGAGAVRFAVDMPLDGKATLALYRSDGQLVRILAQCIPLSKGRYVARWDGMDLWGNLLPAGTALEAKLIASPGVRVFYEFSAAEGDQDVDHVPWLTQPVGTGLLMRTGGWLGDHTGPGAAAAIGDRVFFGSRLVEHGHPLIVCDLEGHKLWGGRLSGWDGPSRLFAADGAVLALVKQTVWRIDPETYKSERLLDTSLASVQAMGVGPGRFFLVVGNPESRISPFQFACRHEDIRLDVAAPQKLGDSAPDFQLPPSRQFTSVFCSPGGHFQMGLQPVRAAGMGHVVVPFREPRKIGTVILGRMPGIEAVEIHALKPGVSYDALRHDPVAAA